MIKYNKRDGIFTVECDACGTIVEFEADSFTSGLEQVKEDGWLIKKRNNQFYCFCCSTCKETFFDMESILER